MSHLGLTDTRNSLPGKDGVQAQLHHFALTQSRGQMRKSCSEGSDGVLQAAGCRLQATLHHLSAYVHTLYDGDHARLEKPLGRQKQSHALDVPVQKSVGQTRSNNDTDTDI